MGVDGGAGLEVERLLLAMDAVDGEPGVVSKGEKNKPSVKITTSIQINFSSHLDEKEIQLAYRMRIDLESGVMTLLKRSQREACCLSRLECQSRWPCRLAAAKNSRCHSPS